MKQYILLLVLMVMGAGINVYAEDVNPVIIMVLKPRLLHRL